MFKRAHHPMQTLRGPGVSVYWDSHPGPLTSKGKYPCPNYRAAVRCEFKPGPHGQACARSHTVAAQCA